MKRMPRVAAGIVARELVARLAWLALSVEIIQRRHSVAQGRRDPGAGGPARQDETYTDSNGRLQTITRTPSGGVPVLIASHSYAIGGQRKETNLLNGSRLLYTYDSKGRLTGLKTCSSLNTTLAAFEYEYDGKDRRTKLKHSHLANEIAFTYDCHDRLTGENSTGNGSVGCSNNIQSLPIGNVSIYSNEACATPSAITAVPAYSATWTYDGAGNRLTKTVNGVLTNYTYDDQNRLTSESGGTNVTYGYDKNGNQTLRNGGVAENFEYDYMNRVKAYQSGATNFQYRYTPTGERLAKVNVAANTEEWFMYDGADVTADYTRNTGSPTWTLARTYANGRAIDSKIARFESSGATYYYVGDAIGTVHELLDSTQTVVRRVLNTAWGEDYPGFTPLLGPTERYGFSHREKDPESGLYHMRARTFDPRPGRFGQNEPVQEFRVMEHYLYAANNPVMNVDRTGRYWAVTFGPKSFVSAQAAQSALRDLEIYTGHQIGLGANDSVWFRKEIGTQYASKEDMEWIRKVEKESFPSPIFGLWLQLTRGDPWHARQFEKAFLANSSLETPLAAFVRGSGQTALQATTFGIYQADPDIQMLPGFQAAIWTARVGLFVVSGGTAYKLYVAGKISAGAVATVTTAAGTSGGAISAAYARWHQAVNDAIVKFGSSEPARWSKEARDTIGKLYDEYIRSFPPGR